MNNDYNNPAFKKLLQKLQEESWQLELLISGFAIFGLFSAWEPLTEANIRAVNNEETFFGLFYSFLAMAISILIFNLLLHVILRGLWIGALGLRYVSGDIDYETLNYGSKFSRFLKRKIGSFDKYIANLENYCSVIFAISFLLIFYVLALLLSSISIGLIIQYFIVNAFDLPKWLSLSIGIPLLSFISLSIVLTFFDFLSQGFLKKKRWLSAIYFPFYRFFSFFSLSFLYRPLVYNFLDNKFGKRIFYALIPFYILIIVATSIDYRKSNYFDIKNTTGNFYANKVNYEDLLDGKKNFIKTIAIPSKVIQTPYLRVFIPFTNAIEDRMFNVNEGLKPEKDKRGLFTSIVIIGDDLSQKNRDSLRLEYLRTFNNTYTFFIDSTRYETDFILGESKTKQLGFESYLNIKDLQEGKHMLAYKRIPPGEKDTITIQTIPFWYYKD
ncbi:MAG: hypothetical protein KDC56_04710 [Flavobacteriaceae bacterium]|nr:hypothetical protein [Flavobacteriaceae bacterium]